MAATLDEIQALLEQIMERLQLLEGRKQSAKVTDIYEGLSDVHESLGLIKGGELRFGTGTPGKGDGFTGLRLGKGPYTYGSTDYVMAGVDADTMQWGVRSCDGSLDGAGGAWTLITSEYIVSSDNTTTEVSIDIPGGSYNYLKIEFYGACASDNVSYPMKVIFNSDGTGVYTSAVVWAPPTAYAEGGLNNNGSTSGYVVYLGGANNVGQGGCYTINISGVSDTAMWTYWHGEGHFQNDTAGTYFLSRSGGRYESLENITNIKFYLGDSSVSTASFQGPCRWSVFGA